MWWYCSSPINEWYLERHFCTVRWHWAQWQPELMIWYEFWYESVPGDGSNSRLVDLQSNVLLLCHARSLHILTVSLWQIWLLDHSLTTPWPLLDHSLTTPIDHPQIMPHCRYYPSTESGHLSTRIDFLLKPGTFCEFEMPLFVCCVSGLQGASVAQW